MKPNIHKQTRFICRDQSYLLKGQSGFLKKVIGKPQQIHWRQYDVGRTGKPYIAFINKFKFIVLNLFKNNMQ